MKLIMEGWRNFITEAMATTIDDLGKPDEAAVQEWLSQSANLPAARDHDVWLDKAWEALSGFADKLANSNLGPEAQESGFDPTATITKAIITHPSMQKSYESYLDGGEDMGDLEGAAISAAELAYNEALDRFEEREGHL